MKLLIIEDEPQLAQSIGNYLSREGYHCELVHTEKEARERVFLHDYDCILLDITLPDGTGMTVMEDLQKSGKNDGVIIISAKDSVDDRIKGLGLGADDYLPKPFHLAELGARVGALIRRRRFNGTRQLQFRELTVDLQSQLVAINGTPLPLTRKEYDLLIFLISNKSRIVSKGAIAEHLSGDMADMIDDFSFVYAHVKNLKKKLSDAHCGEYIKTVYGFGYRWEE